MNTDVDPKDVREARRAEREERQRELWAGRVRRWKDSGESLSAYARELAVPAATMQKWRRRLELDGAVPRG